jgi:large subunit ribosomal protein L18
MKRIHLSKNSLRQTRHVRVRARVTGTAAVPRLSVHRSLKSTRLQLIDDVAGQTLCAIDTRALSAEPVKEKTTKVAMGFVAGKKLAEAAKAKGITRAVFDRGGYHYHGRVAAVAEGAFDDENYEAIAPTPEVPITAPPEEEAIVAAHTALMHKAENEPTKEALVAEGAFDDVIYENPATTPEEWLAVPLDVEDDEFRAHMIRMHQADNEPADLAADAVALLALADAETLERGETDFDFEALFATL